MREPLDNGWGSFNQTQPAWLDRSGRPQTDAWRGCQRRILQPWDPGRLLLTGFALVLILFVVGCIFKMVGGGLRDLGRDFSSIGTLLAWAGAAITSFLVAGRAQRIHRQVLLAPLANRRGVAVRLVDAQIISSLELTLALTGGAVLTSMLLDHNWIWILGLWNAAGTLVIVAALMLAVASSSPPLLAWLLSWAMPWWVSWLQVALGLALIFSWVYVAVPCLNAWQQHGDARPAILAVVLILAAGAVGRFLAIRRLAVAEPD